MCKEKKRTIKKNDETLKGINEKNETLKAINNVKKGIGISKGFSSVAELMQDLNTDD